MTLRPGKKSGIVVMDRDIYIIARMYEVIKDCKKIK